MLVERARAVGVERSPLLLGHVAVGVVRERAVALVRVLQDGEVAVGVVLDVEDTVAGLGDGLEEERPGVVGEGGDAAVGGGDLFELALVGVFVGGLDAVAVGDGGQQAEGVELILGLVGGGVGEAVVVVLDEGAEVVGGAGERAVGVAGEDAAISAGHQDSFYIPRAGRHNPLPQPFAQ